MLSVQQDWHAGLVAVRQSAAPKAHQQSDAEDLRQNGVDLAALRWRSAVARLVAGCGGDQKLASERACNAMSLPAARGSSDRRWCARCSRRAMAGACHRQPSDRPRGESGGDSRRDRVRPVRHSRRQMPSPTVVAGADVVFHLAAIPSVPRSIQDPVPSHEVNIDGTFNVFRACAEAKVRRVVYAASSSAYGDTDVLRKWRPCCRAPSRLTRRRN